MTEKLFANSSAILRNCNVQKISRGPKFQLTCVSTDQSPMVYEGYDLVILAVPLVHIRLDFELENFSIPRVNFGSYHRLFATFVHGTLNVEYFGACKKNDASFFSDPCPTEIIVCTDYEWSFNSVGAQRPVDADVVAMESSKPQNRTYKVFSGSPLSKTLLDKLFDHIIESKSVEWQAYPHYAGVVPEVANRVKVAAFEPADGVYHINVIEWAASAMEMSVIGAKNVALLAYDRLKRAGAVKESGIEVKVDVVDTGFGDRSEL